MSLQADDRSNQRNQQHNFIILCIETVLSVLHRLLQSKTKWKYYTYSTKSLWGSIVHTSRQTTHESIESNSGRNLQDSLWTGKIAQQCWWERPVLHCWHCWHCWHRWHCWPKSCHGHDCSVECECRLSVFPRFAPSWFVEKMLNAKRGKRQAESREMQRDALWASLLPMASLSNTQPAAWCSQIM